MPRLVQDVAHPPQQRGEDVFGWIEDDLGVAHGEVMGDNVRQHHAFKEGLRRFDEYVEGVREGRDGVGFRYDGEKLKGLLKGFVDGERG